MDAADARPLDEAFPAEVVDVAARRHPVEDVRPGEERLERGNRVLLLPRVPRFVVHVRLDDRRRLLDEHVREDAAPVQLLPEPRRDSRVVRRIVQDDCLLAAPRPGHPGEAHRERRLVHRWRVEGLASRKRRDRDSSQQGEAEAEHPVLLSGDDRESDTAAPSAAVLNLTAAPLVAHDGLERVDAVLDDVDVRDALGGPVAQRKQDEVAAVGGLTAYGPVNSSRGVPNG